VFSFIWFGLAAHPATYRYVGGCTILTAAHRVAIVAVAARHRLPAIYSFRYFLYMAQAKNVCSPF
jgi:hypothetical protein